MPDPDKNSVTARLHDVPMPPHDQSLAFRMYVAVMSLHSKYASHMIARWTYTELETELKTK